MKNIIRLGLLAVTVIVAAGCATTGQLAEVDQARAVFNQAQSDPAVQQYAPVALYEARQALERTLQAEDEDVRRHWAYITQKRVDRAQSLAAAQSAENQMQQLQARREEILLQARQLEAQQARQEVQQARQEAKQARTQIEQLEAQRREQVLQAQRRQTEEARAEAEELKQQLSQLQTKVEDTQRGILLTFGDILFAFDKAELKPGAERTLFQLATVLKQHPDRNILIEGHTDNIGSDAYNQELSRARSQVVAQFLTSQGVKGNRILTRGYGEQYPIAPNDTQAGRQENRRVEIVVLDQGLQPQEMLRGYQPENGQRPRSTPSGEQPQ